MKKNLYIVAVMFLISVSLSACDDQAAAVTATTTASAETVVPVIETTVESSIDSSVSANSEIDWETIASEDVKVEHYAISSGTWFYQGIEDEKSIDMDGLKGFTAYTKEAIPETDGYLQYLGVNPDGYHEFEVYDIFGQYFTSMIFISEEQFYLGGDEDEYYVKWNY